MNSLWQPAGKDQVLKVIAALLQEKFPIVELPDLFSGAFLRALNLARRQN